MRSWVGACMIPNFRAAALSDLDTLVRFVRAFYTGERIAFDAPTVRAALAEMLDDPTLGRVWVTMLGDDLIGYLVLTFGYSIEFGGRFALLDELFIDEAHRGQGAGTAALAFVMAA